MKQEKNTEKWIQEQLDKMKFDGDKNEIMFPDKSVLNISKGYFKAIKKKAKKEKITPNDTVLLMLVDIFKLWKKGNTRDKFGETKLDESMTMAESADSVFYSYLRFVIMQEFGKKVGVKVVDINDL